VQDAVILPHVEITTRSIDYKNALNDI
jgi:hypothetical protein